MESLRVRLFAPLPSTSGDVPAPPVKVPYRWFVVCLWWRQVVDEEFEQHITLTAPSGKTPLGTPITLIKMTKRSHRVIIKVDGMPLDEDGEHTLAVLASIKFGRMDESWGVPHPSRKDYSSAW